MLRALGATPVVADAFDGDALRAIVANARPTHVIHQLTALPKGGAKRPSDLAATNRLREVGTRNLLSASIAAGAVRFICGSFAPYAGVDDIPELHDGVAALKSMEAQVVGASDGRLIGGVVLRYGVFYGAGTPLTDDLVARAQRGRLFAIRHDPGRLPFIHIDDAVMATVMALDRGRPGATLDVVDDQPVSFSEVAAVAARLAGRGAPRALPLWVPRLLMPYQTRFVTLRLTLSNAAARKELGWRPIYPTVSDGLAKVLSSPL